MLSNLFAGSASIGIGLYVAFQFVDRFNERSNYVKHKAVRDLLRRAMCIVLARIVASTTERLSDSHLTEWTPEITNQAIDLLNNYTGEDRAIKLDLILGKSIDELRSMHERNEPSSQKQLIQFSESFDKHLFQTSVVLVPGIVRNTNEPSEIGSFFAIERFFNEWRFEIEKILNNLDIIEAHQTFGYVYNLLALKAFRSSEFLIVIDAYDRMNILDQEVLSKYKPND